MAKRTSAAPAVSNDPLPPAANNGGARELIETQFVVPLLDGAPRGYVSSHVETQLDGRQALALRRIFDALDQQGARLINGVRVQSTAAALRWLLDQVPELP